MRWFLLLNKQEFMITSNITGSLSAVISVRSWVTEYLSMNKCYEGSPTLKLQGSFLIIRLLPYLLISIFSIFFPALNIYTVPCVCSSAVHEEVDLRTVSNKGTCACKSTICSWTYCGRNWEHEKMHNQSSNTKPIIFHIQKIPCFEPVLNLIFLVEAIWDLSSINKVIRFFYP